MAFVTFSFSIFHLKFRIACKFLGPAHLCEWVVCARTHRPLWAVNRRLVSRGHVRAVSNLTCVFCLLCSICLAVSKLSDLVASFSLSFLISCSLALCARHSGSITHFFPASHCINKFLIIFIFLSRPIFNLSVLCIRMVTVIIVNGFRFVFFITFLLSLCVFFSSTSCVTRFCFCSYSHHSKEHGALSFLILYFIYISFLFFILQRECAHLLRSRALSLSLLLAWWWFMFIFGARTQPLSIQFLPQFSSIFV